MTDDDKLENERREKVEDAIFHLETTIFEHCICSGVDAIEKAVDDLRSTIGDCYPWK